MHALCFVVVVVCGACLHSFFDRLPRSTGKGPLEKPSCFVRTQRKILSVASYFTRTLLLIAD